MKKLKWTVEFEVAEDWVADGFEFDDEVALEMLATWLGHASYSELGARVVSSPKKSRIDRLQNGEVTA